MSGDRSMLRPIAAILLALSLPASAAPPSEDRPEKAADDGNKMICKRFTETGSLVSSHRTCKTKRDWERERSNMRSFNVANSCATSGQGISCGT
jgi:hypothetical protein